MTKTTTPEARDLAVKLARRVIEYVSVNGRRPPPSARLDCDEELWGLARGLLRALREPVKRRQPRCSHRWVRTGTRNNRRSGWLECVTCHRKKRVETRKR